MNYEERNLFARVIRPTKSRIVSMISRDDDEIFGRNISKEAPEPAIEFDQRAGIARHIAPMSKKHVEVDQINENQTALQVSPEIVDLSMPSAFENVGCDSLIPSPAKISAIFPIPITGKFASIIAFKIVRGGFSE